MLKKKGRILRVKTGVNPNSSSIGADLSWILMGAVTATILVNILDAGIRTIWKRVHRGDEQT